MDSAAILWADGVDPRQENRVRSLSSWKQEVQQVVNWLFLQVLEWLHFPCRWNHNHKRLQFITLQTFSSRFPAASSSCCTLGSRVGDKCCWYDLHHIENTAQAYYSCHLFGFSGVISLLQLHSDTFCTSPENINLNKHGGWLTEDEYRQDRINGASWM